MNAKALKRLAFLGSALATGFVLLAGIMLSSTATAQPPGLSGANHFVAPLSGDQEVPPVDTEATGNATFHLDKDEESISFRLIVANIENVLMSHIHVAPPGENGGVVVWLYPDGPPPELIPGQVNGILATGTITADDLVGSLDGEPLSALIDLMRAGDTYVNVHTEQVPSGEIRGQIAPAGPPAGEEE